MPGDWLGLRVPGRHSCRVRSRGPAPGSVFVFFKRPAICTRCLPCRAWLCLDMDACLSPPGGFPAQRGQRRLLGMTPLAQVSPFLPGAGPGESGPFLSLPGPLSQLLQPETRFL